MISITLLAAMTMAQPLTEKLPVRTEGVLDLNAKPIQLNLKAAKATVLIFVGIECPVANRYAPEMNRIARDFGPKGVRFYRVYVEDQAKLPEIRQHGKEFGLAVPFLIDSKKELMRSLGATITPEAALLTPDGTLAYRGRIDARAIEHGKERANYRHDLRIALTEVLAGKRVTEPRNAAIGCFLQ